MASKFVDEKSNEVARKALMIIGSPGVGKTLLAATAPGALLLDAENRGEHTGIPRLIPAQDATGFDDLKESVRELLACKREKDHILFKDRKIYTVILDTADRVQEFARMKHYGEKSDNLQGFYGDLFDDMAHDLIWPLLALPINIIIVCHVQEKLSRLDEKENKFKAAKKEWNTIVLPEVGLALEGKLSGKLWNYFDYVFHVVKKQSGQRVIITDSMNLEGRHYLAKDKTHLFNGQIIDFGFEKGKPKTDALERVFSSMHTATETQAHVQSVRESLLEYAIEKKVMKDKTDIEGAKHMKDVMTKLKSDLDKITDKTVEKVIEKGKGLVDKIKVEPDPEPETVPEEPATEE